MTNRPLLIGAEAWHPEHWTPLPQQCERCYAGGFWVAGSCDTVLTSRRMQADLQRCRTCGGFWRITDHQMVPIDGERVEFLRAADAMGDDEFQAHFAHPPRPDLIVGVVQGELDRGSDGRFLLPPWYQEILLDSSVGQIWFAEFLTVVADILATRGQASGVREYRLTFQTKMERNGTTRMGYGASLPVPLDWAWFRSAVNLDRGRDGGGLSSADGAGGLTAAIGILSQYHEKRGPLEVTSTA